MSPLAQAIDDLFADPNFAAEAVYLTESGEPISVRFLARRPDRELEVRGYAACPGLCIQASIALSTTARMFPCYARSNSLFSQRNSLFRSLGNSEGTL
jgi:hypothetical protein